MSVIIIGGNECMERDYSRICARHGYKAKIFTRRHQDLAHTFGQPDLCILFTSTVSHSMVQVARETAKKKNVPLARSHTSSIAALDALLQNHAAKQGHESDD